MHPHTQQGWNTALELLRQSVDRKTENTNKTGNGRDDGFLMETGKGIEKPHDQNFLWNTLRCCPVTSHQHLMPSFRPLHQHSSWQPFPSGDVCRTKEECKKEFKESTSPFLKKKKKKDRKKEALLFVAVRPHLHSLSAVPCTVKVSPTVPPLHSYFSARSRQQQNTQVPSCRCAKWNFDLNIRDF